VFFELVPEVSVHLPNARWDKNLWWRRWEPHRRWCNLYVFSPWHRDLPGSRPGIYPPGVDTV